MQRYIIVTDKTNIIRSNSKLVESSTFTRFCFSLVRLFVPLTCRSKVLSLGIPKLKQALFCTSLAYSYL